MITKVKQWAKIEIFSLFLFFFPLFQGIHGEILRLNNADPAPIFSADGKYSLLTECELQALRQKYMSEEQHCGKDRCYFTIDITPFYQSASSGTNYRGEKELIYEDDSQMSVQKASDAGGADIESQTGDAKSVIIGAHHMPIGAIPEPMNFFALFYPWNSADAVEPWLYDVPTTYDIPKTNYPTSDVVDESSERHRRNNNKNRNDFVGADPANLVSALEPLSSTGVTKNNLVAKIIARHLGYSHVPWIFDPEAAKSEGASNFLIPNYKYNPLYFDYTNYTNNFFSVLSYPVSRDPNRLFGYGYFDANYRKAGVRAVLEFKPFPDHDCESSDIGIKLYGGFSEVNIDSITLFDTTSLYQGPALANMFARYKQQINYVDSQYSQSVQQPYEQPNIYQLSDYNSPSIDNADDTMLNSFNQDLFPDQYEQPGRMANQFKALYVQNIQSNMASLGKVLRQSFSPFHTSGLEDTTLELYWRKMTVVDESKQRGFPLCAFMPTASIHLTAPTAPTVPSNEFFAKPIGNNGHYEGGGSLGFVVNFLQTIAIGADAGVSFFNARYYENYPVPTKSLEEGIYTYQANLVRAPGPCYTIGIGMQSTCFLPNVSFFGEYRYVCHMKDSFCIDTIVPILTTVFMNDTHIPSGGILQESTSSVNGQPPKLIPYDTLVAENGILYQKESEDLPYPTKNEVDMFHLADVTAWRVSFINISLKCDLSDNVSLGLLWQQPVSTYNAYNSSTIGITIEGSI